MGYAEVCVNSPAAQRRTFSYAIPSDLNIQVGQAVFVPFGARLLQGIVLKLTEQPVVEETREIVGIIDSLPVLSSAQVELAHWLSDYYFASIFDVVSLMLPPGFGRKALTFLAASYSDSFDLSCLTENELSVVEQVRHAGRISQKKLAKALGQKTSQSLVSKLVRLNVLSRSYELEPIKVIPRVETYLSLAIHASQVEKEVSKSVERQTTNQASLLEFLAQYSQPVYLAEAKKACKFDSAVVKVLVDKGLVRSFELASSKTSKRPEHCLGLVVSAGEAIKMAAWLREKITKRQADLLSFLVRQKGPIELSAVYREIKSNRSIVDALAGKGLINVRERAVRRDPLLTYSVNLSFPLTLTTDQTAALNTISHSLTRLSKKDSEVFLLHGVTGSGKTEIYLQALAEAVKLGKKGIALVPEISLTPQTIERFAARFPGRVAILHSQLSIGERFDEWQRIKDGEFDVVIGPRSALFAPQPNLGLIVIDEEHEWNYKQTDKPPYYNARHVAIKLAELTGAVVILGSATPDVETYYHARKGDYSLLQLPERVTPTLLRTSLTGSSPMPKVEVIDMKDELRAGNRSMFSRALSQAITRALADGGQVILFLNRRGSSTFVQCRQCGFTVRCSRCDVPLTHHAAENVLICHQCNKRSLPWEYCPRCRGRRVKFLGMGTEKLEEETSQAFPQARLLRWDSDTTRQGYSHQTILDKFRNHQADILIGTQMVSKGLDLPQVTLVGVINADTGLNLPDFRAGERTFQLLSQVAGRTGRGPLGGQAIIQTYSPEHYAIQAAAKHDYELFYGKEIDYRCQLHQPPFTRLARLIYTNTNDARCRGEAERMKRVLSEEKEAKGIADLNIIGPAPAFIHRRRGSYRWQLILRGMNASAFLSEISIPQGWTIDIDPVGLS